MKTEIMPGLTVVEPEHGDVELVRDDNFEHSMAAFDVLLLNLIRTGVVSPLDPDVQQAVRDTVQQLEAKQVSSKQIVVDREMWERMRRTHAFSIVVLDYLIHYRPKLLREINTLCSIINVEDVLASPHADWGRTLGADPVVAVFRVAQGGT